MTGQASDNGSKSENPGDLVTKRVEGELGTIDGKKAPVILHIKELTPRDRGLIAFKRLLIFWAIALLWLPFPIIHFVMVPLFLAVGIIAFVMGLGVSQRIESAESTCPLCHERLRFKNLKYKDALKERCAQCRSDLFISLK